jgi:hypothetical protein
MALATAAAASSSAAAADAMSWAAAAVVAAAVVAAAGGAKHLAHARPIHMQAPVVGHGRRRGFLFEKRA